MSPVIYDSLEFAAFIVPRCIQLALDGFVEVRLMEASFALSMYVVLSYFCAATLVGASGWLFVQSFYEKSIVLSRDTAGVLVASLLVLTLAIFSAAAPTTGLSLVHCAEKAADFIQME